MKKGLNPLAWLTLIWIYASLNSCATLIRALDPPQVSLAGIEIKKLGLFEQQFVLQLRLRNPNAVALPIAGMHYNVRLNDLDFAQGVSNQLVTVPALGEAVTNVDVTSNLQTLLNQFGPTAQNRSELSYSLSGHISVVSQTLKLPFEYSGRVALTNPR